VHDCDRQQTDDKQIGEMCSKAIGRIVCAARSLYDRHHYNYVSTREEPKV